MDDLRLPKLDKTLSPDTIETINNTSHLSDLTTTNPTPNYDPETCLKMADDAIKSGDHPPSPKEFDEATTRFNSQAENFLHTLARMDQTIQKFMPDRSVYVKFKLDEIEAQFASLRERIVKQETLDPREIKRLALHGEYVAPGQSHGPGFPRALHRDPVRGPSRVGCDQGFRQVGYE